MDVNKRVVMLILTDNCNLRCTYCYENDGSGSSMSFETAKAILDKEFDALPANDRRRIEFFGGEALLRFELIKKIYDYIMEKYPEGETRFAFTTNGTKMHGEVRQWFWERRQNFECTLSLDGTAEMHNLNRRMKDGRGSFEQIDLPFFLEAWPGCTAKMTISLDTLPDFAEGIMYLEKLGFYCKATFASGIDWKLDENADILMREMNKLTAYYSQNNIPLCNMLNLDLRAIFATADAPFRYCEAGVGKTCYDMRGRAYPCQGLASVSVGEEKAALFENERFENFCMSANNPCRACLWKRICRTCYAANYLETGSIEQNCESMCFLSRISILASSAIQFHRIIKKEEKNAVDLLTLKAVGLIQKKVLTDYGMAVQK